MFNADYIKKKMTEVESRLAYLEYQVNNILTMLGAHSVGLEVFKDIIQEKVIGADIDVEKQIKNKIKQLEFKENDDS